APLGMTLRSAQFADCLRVIWRAKDGGAGDENIRAVLNRDTCGFGVDAAIDFDVDLATGRVRPTGGLAIACFVPIHRAFHFLHLFGAKRLTTESRMHGHD